MTSTCLSAVLAICAAVPLLASESPTIHGDRVAFTISNQVKLKDPSRFGLNFMPQPFTHWGEEPVHNEWWSQAINPVECRVKVTATGGGADFVECLPEKLGGPKWGSGLGYYDIFVDGFFDGGEAWIYRYVGNKAELVRQGTIARYLASKDGANRFTFTASGPAVQKDDVVVYRVERRDFPAGMRGFKDRAPMISKLRFLDGSKEAAFIAGGGSMVIDTDVPEGGGSGSLRITVPPAAGPAPLGYWLLSNSQADWPRLRPGANYTLRFWAKGKDVKPDGLTVQVASLAEATFSPDATWKPYTVNVIGASPKGAAEPLLFTVAAGTLWLDNITLTEECSTAPGAFYPEVVDTLKRFRPSTLRLWALTKNVGFGRSLVGGLAPAQYAPTEFNEHGGAENAIPVSLHQELTLCKDIGTAPWIVMSTLYRPQEYDQLVEYLAGPADSPMGKLRASWGQAKPWADVFPEIKLELGNETWNPAFAMQGYPFQGKNYGTIAQWTFTRLKASPYFRSDKFQLVANGWVANTTRQWGFGPQAIEVCPAADASDIAYYTGGWDAVGVMKADNPLEGWRNILTYSYRLLRPRSEEYMKVMDEIGRERGRPIQTLVYEAGPGYTLPGPGKFDIVEQREGKSMAQAVNSLDSFMINLELGFGDQSFFLFRNGHYWSSHNRTWGEHIAYKALGLRNDQLQGVFMASATTAMITMDLPEVDAQIIDQSNSANRSQKKFPALKGVPLATCYPFKQGKRWSYMLYSRRTDAAVPVTLSLPYEPSPTVHWYTLGSSDPAAHNIDSEVVKVQHEVKQDGAKEYSLSLPPFTVLVLVNEER